ncbi:MAG: hypothetical protein ACI9OJ_001850, partial [Myxococcota bacterium]
TCASVARSPMRSNTCVRSRAISRGSMLAMSSGRVFSRRCLTRPVAPRRNSRCVDSSRTVCLVPNISAPLGWTGLKSGQSATSGALRSGEQGRRRPVYPRPALLRRLIRNRWIGRVWVGLCGGLGGRRRRLLRCGVGRFIGRNTRCHVSDDEGDERKGHEEHV